MSTILTEEIAAIKAWMVYGTGLSLVLMRNEPRTFVKPAWSVVELPAITAEGTDRVVYSGPDNLPKVQGTRVLTFRLAVESFSQAADKLAAVYLERARACAVLPVQQARMTAANMAFVSALDITNEDYEIDQRLISRYVMSARFRWGFEVDITNEEEAVSTIDTVEGEGTITNGEPSPITYSATRP